MNNKAGRKFKITDKILPKLQMAFAIGATDEEACEHVGIGTSSLYRYEEKHPEFRKQKRLWETCPKFKAKQALFDGLDDPDKALKYLKNVSSDEFSEKIKEDKQGTYDIKVQIEFVDP